MISDGGLYVRRGNFILSPEIVLKKQLYYVTEGSQITKVMRLIPLLFLFSNPLHSKRGPSFAASPHICRFYFRTSCLTSLNSEIHKSEAEISMLTAKYSPPKALRSTQVLSTSQNPTKLLGQRSLNYPRKISTFVSKHFRNVKSFAPTSNQPPGFW